MNQSPLQRRRQATYQSRRHVTCRQNNDRSAVVKLSQKIMLFSLVVSGAIIIGVEGLPHHDSSNNNNRGHNFNSRRSHINSLGGGGQQRSSAVTLHDEFPCEETSSAAAAVGNGDQSTATASSTRTSSSFTSNSFAEMNNLQIDKKSNSSSSSSISSSTAKQNSLTTRGGGGIDDDEIDLMVESLIAGLDRDEESEEEEESEELEEESEEEEESAEEEEVEQADGLRENESDKDEQIQIASVDEEESDDAESVDTVEESFEGDTQQESIAAKADDSSGSHHSKPAKIITPNSGSPATTNNSNHRPPPLQPLATPTNAYYRFLVRRGPKGHILASITLISIQWVHAYIPILYKTAASLLLKLHIYDPKVLWKRDRLRREEEDRRRRGIYPQKKKGVIGSVFSKKDASQTKERNAQQQRADLQASQTLKQLYKAIKSGEGSGGALSEVKYRYLSVAFRRKYGLGKEYRVEKPIAFLGEVLDGDAHMQRVLSEEEEAVVDEMVFLDGGEEDGDAEAAESAIDYSVGGQTAAPRQRRKERKKINDWVVQAFGSSRKQQPSKSFGASSGGGESPLWKTVDNSAIMQAAWESRAAEQLAWQKKRKTKQRGSGGGAKEEDESEKEDAESLGASSGYGASKMFQSVMTRVGSNGRLPGAYPMDAPPIEECADSRGVVEFARRYGYGDWKESAIYYGEDSEDEGESFGGGDLFSAEPASQGRKVRRRKKQLSSPVMDVTDDLSVKRRKRRKKASSVTLGLSGGGVSWESNNRVSIEFGVSSSPRRSSRTLDPPTMAPASSSRRMELNDIKSKLSERSALFTPDTRVNAPTELLNKSRERLRRKKHGDES